MRSFTVKETHIVLAVREILCYIHRQNQRHPITIFITIIFLGFTSNVLRACQRFVSEQILKTQITFWSQVRFFYNLDLSGILPMMINTITPSVEIEIIG